DPRHPPRILATHHRPRIPHRHHRTPRGTGRRVLRLHPRHRHRLVHPLRQTGHPRGPPLPPHPRRPPHPPPQTRRNLLLRRHHRIPPALNRFPSASPRRF